MKRALKNLGTIGAMLLAGLSTDYVSYATPKQDLQKYEISLGSDKYTLDEGDTREIKVSSSKPIEESGLKINFECFPLGNTSNEDYAPSKGSIALMEGQKEKTIYFSAMKDSISETDENLEIKLSVDDNLSDKVSFGIDKAIITINGDSVQINEDNKPRCGCYGNKDAESVKYFLKQLI